jgi:hypothetical protein
MGKTVSGVSILFRIPNRKGRGEAPIGEQFQ